MNKNIRSMFLLAALALILVISTPAQQKSGDTAVDPVCGMTVVKANAKATFDYKGTTYYFCNTGCKDAFAKEPEKYIKAQPKAEAAKAPEPMGGMPHMHQAQAAAAAGTPMAGCPMMAQGGMMRHGQAMGKGMAGCPMMTGGRMRLPGRPMIGAGLAPLFMLYGDKIEAAVENTKDGAALKVMSKDPEVAKAIQVHMAEHIAMMKKMKENAAKAPAAEAACCADCPMQKK